MPDARRRGLLHAQNWTGANAPETSVVRRIRRDDGRHILTFTEAAAARVGAEPAGNRDHLPTIDADRDYRAIVVPLALSRRKVSSRAPPLALHAV